MSGSAPDEGDVVAWHSRAVTCLEAGNLEQAEQFCRKVLAVQPAHARALANLGVIAQRRGSAAEAEAWYEKALAEDPSLAPARFNLAMLLFARGSNAQAIAEARRAVELAPDRADWPLVLGEILGGMQRPLDARPALETALQRDPRSARACGLLAGCHLEMGDAEQAALTFRSAERLDPADQAWTSNRLLTLNYIPGLAAEDIYGEHVAWGNRIAAPGSTYRNARGADRPLRVGFVSPDLREHAMAYFIEPVLRHRDRDQIEYACYSDAGEPDETASRIRGLADLWRDTSNLDNRALADVVRQDRIDLLVDLAGHTAGGQRLALFAEKPVPVQASWIGYLNTVGLRAIDYRLTDGHASPPGMEAVHVERLARLPFSQWCYAPDRRAPAVGVLPARKAGRVTFGAFHVLHKISPPVVALWARLLREVPNARLLLVAPGLDQLGERMAERFRREGVDSSRLEMRGRVGIVEYLALHNEVDINLDAFPYAGGTTTCHALWMGVPAVTLCGSTPASRGGASVLHAAGLAELLADSENQYLQIATLLASDLERMAMLRASLRERVATSPLCDTARFASALEASFRNMWRAWCAQEGA